MATAADARTCPLTGRRSPRRRVGIFGGTFDPPHNGHVSAARDVVRSLELDELVWVPAARSPLKLDVMPSPPDVRLEMVEAAAAADPRFSVDACELGREGPSWTVDTLEELAAGSRGLIDYVLVIGMDQFVDFERWKEPERIRELADIAVMDRDGDRAEGPEILRVPVTRVDVSSTDVRARVARGESIDDLVPEAVGAVIRREGLYVEGDSA